MWSGSSCGEAFFINRIEGIPENGNNNTVSFQQLLELDGLKSVLCSSFSTDYQWLLTQIPNHVGVTVIAHWNRKKDKVRNMSITLVAFLTK